MPAKTYDIKPKGRSEVDLLVALMDATTKTWMDNLKDVTDKEFKWQAIKGGHSIGMVVLHMVMAEYWWIQGVVLGQEVDMKFISSLGYDKMDIRNGVYGTPIKQPKEWYLKQMKAIRRKTKAAVKGLKPSHMGEGRGNKYSLRWVLHHLIEHEAYHAGQFVLLQELYKNTRKR